METGFNTLVSEEDNLEHATDFYSYQDKRKGWVNFTLSYLFWFFFSPNIYLTNAGRDLSSWKRRAWVVSLVTAWFWPSDAVYVPVDYRYQKTYVSLCSPVAVGLTVLAVVLLLLNIGLGVYRKLGNCNRSLLTLIINTLFNSWFFSSPEVSSFFFL